MWNSIWSCMSSLHCKIPEAHDRASLRSRPAEMKWIRIRTELFSQDRRWGESEHELRSWRHFSRVLSLVMILGHSGGQVASYKCPSSASTTAVVALDRRCINFLAEAEKADSLSLPLFLALSSCLPIAAFAISGPASSTTNWSSQPRAICESSPRLHAVECIRISNTLNILKHP